MVPNCRTRRKNCASSQTSLPLLRRARLADMLPALLSIMLIAANISNIAAKMDTELLQDDELLMQAPKSAQVEALEPQISQVGNEDSNEHYNLYRSELKRLSYETIHRILRDENEPIYRRADASYRYYKKRAYQPTHTVVRRAIAATSVNNDAPQPQGVTQPPAVQHALRITNTQLRHYDAARDYHGNHSAINTLDLSNNLLQDVNLSAFTALQQAELANNSLTTIPLNQRDAPSSNIVSLNLNDNQIVHATAVSSANLRELHLSGNQITQLAHLNLSMLSALETLDLSCNHIAELETAFFPQRMHFLKHLNLAYNRIGTIYRETFYNLLSLNTLLLSHNNISDIDYETFLALPNLQFLDLSHNQLRGEAIRALQGIPDLVRLSIAYNPEVGAAMQEFVASWSLKELDASGTGLCQIPAALAQSVRTLKLTDNWLKIINCGDLDSYPLLQYLDLSHSRIEDIEDDALGRLEILETLFLDHNRLRKVPVSLPTSLEHLFLQHNEIMDLQAQTFQGLNNLQTLDLSGNKLLYLPALPLPKLLTLNLRAAGLRGVSQAMVHTLPRLRDLLLDENPIKCSDLLSIAEWATPCRIVERNGPADSSNIMAEESYNIERNSIMGDLGEEQQQQQQQQQQQLDGDNRIGRIDDGEEQVIALSASAAKLGQQKRDEAAATAEATDAAEVATNIELKQKFVRMHNFFEKFKSNCNVKRQTAVRAPAPASTPTPDCAVEWEASGEQSSTSELTFNLPNELRAQSEKLNVKATATATTTTSMPRQDAIGETMSSSAQAKAKEGAPRQKKSKKEVKNVKAEMKLFKFNQKNFTPEMAESSEATTKNMKTTTADGTTATLATSGTEAPFDYKTQVSKTTATATTTTTRLPTIIRTRATTTQTTRFPTTIRTTATTKFPITAKHTTTELPITTTVKPTTTRKITTTNEHVNLTLRTARDESGITAATTTTRENQTTTEATTTPAVVETLRQLATVATGSGAANIANLLRQQITATTVPALVVNGSTTSILKTLSTTTTVTNIVAAPRVGAKTMLLATLQDPDSDVEANDAQTITTTTSALNAKLTATSSLNNTKEISVNEKQQRLDNAAATAATTTNSADVATSLEMAKNASTARTAQQLSERTSATPTTETSNDNTYMKTTKATPTTTTILQTATTSTKLVAARYLQMKRSQAVSGARATHATKRVAATKLINADEATFGEMRVGALQTGQSDAAKSELTTQKAALLVETTTAKVMPTTQQLSEATIQTKSVTKQKVDNNLTRNDSDNDGHKVQANKQEAAMEEEEEDKEQSMIVAATTMAVNELAKPKTTQFWQQHNFKRANPYPNDISGQRRHSAEEPGVAAGSTTEHNIKIETIMQPTTSGTHAPTHKHEPLLLHIRDRHLIGTPLLMHRGQNMLVEAAEVLKQTTVTVKSTTTTTTPTLKLSKASTLKITNEPALAKSQPTEAEHQAYSHPSVEQAVAEQQESAVQAHQQSNNFTHTERSQAEAINVQTNVTPGLGIGGAEHEGNQKQHNDSPADKQMLAGKAVNTNKTTTTAKWIETTAATTTDNINNEQHKVKASEANSSGRRHELERKALPKKHDDFGGGGSGGGRRKPTLIMKKMTIQTQHTKHTQTPHQQAHYMLNTPRENEAVLRDRGVAAAAGIPHALAGKLLKANSEAAANGITHNWFEGGSEQAEFAATHNLAQHKHSTVNTPIIRDDNHTHLLAAMDEVAALQNLDAPTAQHSISSQRRDHEPLQVQERAALHSQRQQWLDVREVGGGTTHPGIVLLLSFSLLAVLLIGLMHVYRCDVLPWRRHLLSHQQRPHLQRQFNAGADDDAHSFLHYHNNGEGQQQQQRAQQPPRWHHGERTRANYSSPLHNLHVRELQKTSAVEVEAATRITRSYYDVRPFEKSTAAARRHGSAGSNASGGSGEMSRNSSSSLSSTRSSSTAGSMEADDAFYVEMAEECGQLGGCVSANDALHSDMLPMELLTVTAACKRNDECNADTALHEAVSQRAADANIDIERNTVIGEKQAYKTQSCAGNGAPLINDSRRKVSAKTATASSSTRKFDLW